MSSGPALGVWAAIGEPDDLFWTLKTYYAPLDQAAEHSELFRSAILWYLSLWVDVGSGLMAVQVLGGIALNPIMRARFWRWLDDEDDDSVIWRSERPRTYWTIISIETALTLYLWYRCAMP